MEITGTTLQWGVVNTLVEAFPGIKVYKEKVRQNMVLPCFFVWQLNALLTPQMQGRSVRDYLYQVRYHPPEKIEEPYTDMFDKGQALTETLRKINLKDQLPIYAVDSQYEIKDGYLLFTTSYRINSVTIEPEAPDMQVLTENTKTKED